MQSDEEIREAVERQVMAGVVDRLNAGDSRERVVETLVADGFDPEAAAGYVDALVADPEKRGIGLSSLLATLALLAVFAGIVVGAYYALMSLSHTLAPLVSHT